jgi:LPXTG-motif cell wall-anchored protein
VIERIGSLAATGSSVTPWLIVAGVVVLLGVIALVVAGIVRSRRAERQVQDAAEPDAGAGPSAPVEPGSPVGPGGPVEPSSPIDDGGAENPQTHQQPRDPTQADDGPLK